jgi:PST family polysaccharide transporter
MEEKAIRGVPWTFMSFAGSKLVAVATTLVLARLLVPSDFGVMALAITATSFLYWVGDLGFAGTLIHRQDLDRRVQGTIFTLMMGSSLLATALAIGLAPVAADVFHTPRLTGVLAAMSGVLFLGGITGFYEAVCQRELEFRKRFAGYVAQSLGNASVAIPLAVAGAGVWSLVAGQLAAYTAMAIVLVWLSPYVVRPRLERAAARDIFSSSKGFVVQGITLFIRQNIDTVVVGRRFGTHSLGFYSMAIKLGDLSYWALAGPVANVTFPAFSRSRQRGEDIRPAFISVLRLLALVGCPFGILLSGAADPLVRVVFGERWLPMVGPLTVLGLWAAVRPIDTTLGWLLNSVGKAGAAAWVSVAVIVPLIPAFIFATHVGRLSAVALVILGDTFFSLFALSALVRRYVELPMREIWQALVPVLVAAPLMWGATWGASQAVGSGRPVLALVAAVGAGLATYLAVIALVDRSLLRRAVGQILRTVGRTPTPIPS